MQALSHLCQAARAIALSRIATGKQVFRIISSRPDFDGLKMESENFRKRRQADEGKGLTWMGYT
ncbi:hypothetical protein BI334_09815 [Moorena producens 3L]|nr:hypothetical protein BI334_09815 [Moorena producens 3L]